MLEQPGVRTVEKGPAATPVSTFLVLAVLFGGCAVWGGRLFLPTGLWVAVGYLGATFFVGRSLISGAYPHASFGLCNAVTLARVALVSVVFGALFSPATVAPWVVVGLGGFALALDGLDGWAARRAGLQSEFGARFDVETDAALAATLALWLMLSQTAGAEVLILGFTRYVFVVAGWCWPQLNGDLPPSFRRKAICVLQIGTLIALTAPVVPEELVLPLSFGASAALLYSFGVDLVHLLGRDA